MRFDKSEAWNKELLSKYAKKITSKNKNNSIENIICNSAQNGLIQQKDFFDRTIVNNENTENYYVIEQGDFVYNPRKSVTAPYGPVNVYEYENLGIVSPLYLCFKVDGIDKKFLNYYFKSSAWYKYIYENGDSGARHDRVSIKDDVFLAQPIIVPNLTTQNKVASFLSKIDQRIETQSKIIEDLELYKNTIANQLIYNNPLLDRAIPLKEYATLKNGYAFKSDTYSESGNYKVVTIANVTGNKYISTSDCNSIEALPIDIQSHQILKLGDILISLTGNVGRVSIVNEVNCLLNQRVGVLFFTNIQLKKYLFQVLSNKLFETKMVQKGQGAAQKNIGNEDVESFLIPISNNLEYINKITKVLDALDGKIALKKQILEKLKEQKKFLLSNMFI